MSKDVCMTICLSVGLSVCASAITLRYCVKKAKSVIEILSLPGNCSGINLTKSGDLSSLNRGAEIETRREGRGRVYHSPSWGRGESPAEKRFLVHFELERTYLITTNFVLVKFL